MRSTDSYSKNAATLILVDPQLHNRYPLVYDMGYVRKMHGEVQGRWQEIYQNIQHRGLYQLWWEQGGELTILWVVIDDIQWWHDFTTQMYKLVFTVLPDATTA